MNFSCRPVLRPFATKPSKADDRGIKKNAPLTREGEVHYFEEMAKGGATAKKARDEFIVLNQGIIYFIAKKYTGISTLSFDDLMQEGNIGLLSAIDNFDHRRGYKFSTYAPWWVRREVLYAIANTGSTIRLPNHLKRYRLNRFHTDFEKAEGRPPTNQELSELTGLSVERIKHLTEEFTRKPLSLDQKLDEPQSPLAEKATPQPADGLDFLALKRVQECLPTLPDQWRKVIELRFGPDESTHEEIGKTIGVTYQRIQQIIKDALKKLRKMIEENEPSFHSPES